MAEIHAQKIKEHRLETVLDEDIDFVGELSFDKELMIKGKFKGTINAKGDLYINKDADVEAKIRANAIHVQGRVRGDMYAKTIVELVGKAEVIGNITSPKIVMETGCRFEGSSHMVSPDVVPSAPNGGRDNEV